MNHVAIDDLPPNPHADADRRDLTDPLDAAGIALNRFTLAPGEWVSGLHAHEDQEEVYVVLAGTLTVETLDGERTVGGDEAVRFAPGEYHAGRNEARGDRDSDDRVDAADVAGDVVELLALGAPRHTEVIRIPLACPDCGGVGLDPRMGDGGPVLHCPDCGGEADATCPECRSPEMLATVPEGRESPVGVCQDCGAVAET